MPIAHEGAKLFKVREYFCCASQKPAADFFDGHDANQINRYAQPMRKRQFPLGARAFPGMPVPITDNGIAVVLNQVQIISDDFAHRLLKSGQISLLPRPEFTHLSVVQVLLFVLCGIVNIVSQGLEQRLDFSAPSSLAEIRRVLDGTRKIKEHFGIVSDCN